MAFVMRAVPCVGYSSRKDLHAREPGNVIETHEQKIISSSLNRFGVASFILDIAWQRAYKDLS